MRILPVRYELNIVIVGASVPLGVARAPVYKGSARFFHRLILCVPADTVVVHHGHFLPSYRRYIDFRGIEPVIFLLLTD